MTALNPDSNKLAFPPGFLWGAATAALQIEGADGRGDSVWDVFCREQPHRIHQAASPSRACDHFGRLAEDLDWLSQLGHTSYRMSLSWPRLFPTEGTPSPEGFDFYHRLFDGLQERGIVANVTLYHWDLPAYLESWQNPKTLPNFLEFAAAAFRAFGSKVPLWASFNEPGWTILNGYVTGLHPPNRQDVRAALDVSLTMLEGHARTMKLFREVVPNGQLGLVLNMSEVYPASDRPEDRKAARRADAVLNRWFSEPILRGRFPRDAIALYGSLVPKRLRAVERLCAESGTDFLGLNYYYPHYASANASATEFHLNNSGNANDPCRFSVAGLFRFVPNPRGRYTDWNWEIDPNGLYDLLLRVHRLRPDLPVYVTENGLGLQDVLERGLAGTEVGPRVHDPERIAFVCEHLEAVHRALEAGVDVRGYYMWSLMDNFSWINGYKKRYGFLYVDRDTLDRTPKASAWWYRQVIEANALPVDSN